MSVTQRGKSWQVYLVVGGHKVRESYPTQAEAITREAALKVASVTGSPASAPDKTDVSLTLGQLRDKVITRVWQGSKSEKLQAYLADKVVSALGEKVLVRDLTAKMIDRYIERLEAKRNSNGTINRKLAVLSKMLHFAREREYITTVPHIEFKKAGRGRERFMSYEEEDKVLALLKLWSKDLEHDLVIFLLDTGARIGEALKLQPRDVGEKYVTFRDPKNGITRAVPMTPRVLGLASRDYSSLDYQQFRLLWNRVRLHLGLTKDKDFVPHMLRHTCASRLVQAGAKIQYVKEWMGHKNIGQTMRYAHLAPDSLDSLTALLERKPAEKPRHLGVAKGGQ